MTIKSFSRFLILSCILPCTCIPLPLATAMSSAPAPIFPNCLNFSSSRQTFRPGDYGAECAKDALNFGTDKTIHDGEKLFHLTPDEVRFIGCTAAPFVTFPALGLKNSKFTIYYPTEVEFKRDGYFAPLLHEMGHVFQLKQAGSYAKLKASVDDSIERIELGADFIAGIGANRLSLEPKAFLLNLSLVGSYNSSAFDYHGRPEDRASAFRQGYFYQDDASTVTEAYSDFQDNRFAQIKHQ